MLKIMVMENRADIPQTDELQHQIAIAKLEKQNAELQAKVSWFEEQFRWDSKSASARPAKKRTLIKWSSLTKPRPRQILPRKSLP